MLGWCCCNHTVNWSPGRWLVTVRLRDLEMSRSPLDGTSYCKSSMIFFFHLEYHWIKIQCITLSFSWMLNLTTDANRKLENYEWMSIIVHWIGRQRRISSHCQELMICWINLYMLAFSLPLIYQVVTTRLALLKLLKRKQHLWLGMVYLNTLYCDLDFVIPHQLFSGWWIVLWGSILMTFYWSTWMIYLCSVPLNMSMKIIWGLFSSDWGSISCKPN